MKFLFYLLFYDISNTIEHQVATINIVECAEKIREDRFNVISSLVRTDNTNSIVKGAIDSLLYDNTDVFHIKGDKLTCCDLIEHQIPLYSGTKPVNVRPYVRRSKFEIEEIEKKVKELRELGVVEPCRSPYNSPIHLIKKGLDENGKLKTRICLDFRALNEVSIPEVFPVMQVVDILDQLLGQSYYSSLDLSKGYNQIRIAEDCKDKTAFTCGYKTFRFCRLSLGLKNAGHSFNRGKGM